MDRESTKLEVLYLNGWYPVRYSLVLTSDSYKDYYQTNTDKLCLITSHKIVEYSITQVNKRS